MKTSFEINHADTKTAVEKTTPIKRPEKTVSEYSTI
jgi:hypothetical protein|tara:strand:+ start:1277 stop:1384 length:108 start_codon:yes stop_codon:yes gene_type:complete